jgi:uncharacterized iron-regulated protein
MQKLQRRTPRVAGYAPAMPTDSSPAAFGGQVAGALRSRAMRRIAAWALLCLGCAASSQPAAPPHPLEDRIWNVAESRFLDEPALVRDLASQRYVLLGEVHDNPAQHRIQAGLLRQLARAGRRPALVFEMIARDREDALAEVQAQPTPRPDDIRQAVDWDASGWPSFTHYAPVFAAALDAGLPIFAGDLASADRATLRRDGIAGLDPAHAAALGLESPLDAARQATLEGTIRAGHCDLLPEASVPRLVEFQRARDGQLARALMDAARRDGAVLIAGAGHVRRDVGVPAALAHLEPEARLASLALVEVDASAPDPQRLLAERFGDPAPFDYVWFTERAPRADPCEAMRRHLAAPKR